jgi:broad specificity phosphatase PhoE
MTRLLLIRHGETQLNEQGRFQGHGDAPLTERGRRQAVALARVIQNEEIHAAYSSDLCRARQTADIITAGRPFRIVDVPALREIAFGDWEGCTYADIQQKDPDNLRRWDLDPTANPPPGGEGLEAIDQRVGSLLNQLRDRHPGATVLIATHGGPIRLIACRALDLPALAHRRLVVSPGSLSEICFYADSSIVVRLNYVPPESIADRHMPSFEGRNPWAG